MPFNFQVEILGEQQISRVLSRVSARARDFRPLWRELADDFLLIEQHQFNSEGGAGSGGWAPLSPTYAAQKAKAGFGGGLLVREGDLRASLTTRGAGHIEEMSDFELRLGTSVAHARFHQTGTSRMPARKPVELSEADKRRWTRFAQRFLVHTIDAAVRSEGRAVA